MTLFEWLEAVDRDLFLFLNGIHSPVWDEIMVWISDKKSWIPFYVLLLLPLWLTFKRKIVYPLVSVAVLILLTDQASVHLFKNVVERYRPCHNQEIMDMVHIVNGKCGGKYGFLSSHAANSFALAVFLSLQWVKKMKWLVAVLLIWAVIASYSRIYLGVHYPSDIVAGALMGTGIAFLINRNMRIWMERKK